MHRPEDARASSSQPRARASEVPAVRPPRPRPASLQEPPCSSWGGGRLGFHFSLGNLMAVIHGQTETQEIKPFIQQMVASTSVSQVSC